MVSKAINPEMVVIARESRGLTQSELARLLSVSQGKISKIEGGFLGISGDMLQELSRVLDYPENFFTMTDPIVGFGVGMFYHRKRQSLSGGALGKIHAEMNIRRMQLLRLLRSVEIQECKFPCADVEEYDGRVEEVARVVRESWMLPRGPVKNLTRAIEDAGGIIIRWDFGTKLLDAASQWVQGLPPLFFVNTNVPGDRLRFTLAHELGHMLMHRVPGPQMEEEAHRFASEFLMPKDDIYPSLSEISLPRLASLKPYWKVSMGALLKRATDLKRISERQARYLWMQMGKAGYRSHEPSELDIPIEEPTLFNEIINAYQHHLNYTSSELSQLLAIHEHELRSKYLGQRAGLTLVGRSSPPSKGIIREFKPQK